MSWRERWWWQGGDVRENVRLILCELGDEDGVFGDRYVFAIDFAPYDDGVHAVAGQVNQFSDVSRYGELLVLDRPFGCRDPTSSKGRIDERLTFDVCLPPKLMRLVIRAWWWCVYVNIVRIGTDRSLNGEKIVGIKPVSCQWSS